jgi:hypothetical protein
LNEWQELCLSIKEGVKEFYVQVTDQRKGKTEEEKREARKNTGTAQTSDC